MFTTEIFPLKKTSGENSYCPNYDSVSLVRPVPNLVAVKMVGFGAETIWSFHFFLLSTAGECVCPVQVQFQGQEVKARQDRSRKKELTFLSTIFVASIQN